MFTPGTFPADGPLDRQWRKVRGPKGTEPLRCVLLRPRMLVLMLHWDTLARRSVPCLDNGCWYCKHFVESRPKGYFSAQNIITGEWFVAELAEGCASAMEKDARFKEGYRGWEMCFRRYKPHPNAPVYYEAKRLLSADQVAPDFDPLPSIKRLYQDLVVSGRLMADAEVRRRMVGGSGSPPPKPSEPPPADGQAPEELGETG